MINMQELQISKKDEEFSLELLKEGNLVTSYQVNKRLNEFFDDKTIGLPYFNPIRLNKYDVSNPQDWNKMFKSIREDLENAYEIYNSQSDYGAIIQGDFDNKVNSTHMAIDSLIMETKILEEYMKKKTAYEPYIIKFGDLSDVNTKNLVVNNVPYTTSEIDFNSSSLRNELQSTPNDKVDLSEAIIKLSSTHTKISTSKDIKEVFSELKNSGVTITTSSQSNTINKMNIDIELKNEALISRVELSGCSLFNTTVSIYISEDGKNYTEKKTGAGDQNLIWRFNSTKVKYIRIVLLKDEFDYSDEKNNYCYYVISNISAYCDKYKKASVYTSKTIEFKDMISSVTLKPKHELPPMTDIAYFVGVQNGNNNVDWRSIKPKEKLDLDLLYKEEMILNYQVSNVMNFGARRYSTACESFYFRIHDLPVNTNLNSIELRAGHSQWLLESLNVTDKYEGSEVPTDFKCHTNDYSKARVSEIAPLDSTIMEIRCERENNYFVMSQYAICEEDTIIENRYIEFDIETREVTNADGSVETVEVEKFDAILLINGKQVFPKNNKYTFKLKKGENIIQIMFMLANHTIYDDAGNRLDYVKNIRHNFNLMSYCKALFAGPQMQRINHNALLKNIDKHSLKYYSIKEENLKEIDKVDAVDKFRNMIVTKFDPNYIIKPVDPLAYDDDSIEVNNARTKIATLNNDLGVAPIKTFDDIINNPNYDENNDVIKPVEGEVYPEYIKSDIKLNNSAYFRMYIKFNHMLPSVKEKLTDKYNNSNIKLRVMAKLTTGDVTVSPVIRSIEVIGE